MSDFKAPDVVWINKADLASVVKHEWHDRVCVCTDEYSEPDDEACYTLTTTAEANTRKAVRDVLQRVRDEVFPQGMRGGLVHINRQWWSQYFDKLLTQYQEPTQPTEASNG